LSRHDANATVAPLPEKIIRGNYTNREAAQVSTCITDGSKPRLKWQ